MLTDYHVHLRPDEPGTTADKYFTAANADRYREAAGAKGITELGVSEHVHRFYDALDVWDHPFWRENAADDLESYAAFVREETDLRLGIEADFIAGREDRMANLLDRHEWDYVIGSVHFLRDLAVDMPGTYDVWGRGEPPEKVWKRYFETLAEAARSGMFDIMAHPDLVKVWGKGRPGPEGDRRRYYEPAVEAFADSGVTVEMSTAGLRKPVGEIYPARDFLEMIVEAGCPIALSSDAHRPEHIGWEYDRALELLADVGVTELSVFERRQGRLEPMG